MVLDAIVSLNVLRPWKYISLGDPGELAHNAPLFLIYHTQRVVCGQGGRIT